MKNNNNEVDKLLSRALSSEEKLSSELIQKLKNKLNKEDHVLVKSNVVKRSFASVAAAVLVFMLISTTVFAAWHFLKPSQIVDKFGNKTLSAAFDSKTAININSSVTSGEYIFTLLAIVSGKDITDMPYYSDQVQDGRTYAVLAIQNVDGTPMANTWDDNYGETPFFASPLVKGLKPWQVNVFTMNGGYCETVVDGVRYRMVECDDIAVFADRGLYFAISTSNAYDINAFIYNEETGEIAANEKYNGASAVFNLPIDKKFANPEKAEQYLNDLYSPDNSDNSNEATNKWDNINWEDAVSIPSTVKELTVGANGEIDFSYDCEYGSGNISAIFDTYFVKNNTAQSKIISVMSDDVSVYAVRFSMDEKGVVTGEIVVPK